MVNDLMEIVIRVDSSLKIGAGHVMRCLTLARKVKKYANVKFICRNREGNLIDRIEAEGFEVFRLHSEISEEDVEEFLEINWLGTSQDQDVLDCSVILKRIKPDWVIVDHYGIDDYWHTNLKKFYKKLMVIDDLANRSYNCDILLDQNFFYLDHFQCNMLSFQICFSESLFDSGPW